MPNWEEKKAQRNNTLPTSLNGFYFIKGGRYLNSKMKKKCFSVVRVLYVRGIKDTHNAGLGYSKITANSSIANR